MEQEMEQEIRRLLIKHEGLRLFPYVDSVGKITIGVGRNLSDVGISESEAMFLFENDLARAMETAERVCERYGILFRDLPKEVKIVLVDMAFNLGYRLGQFKKMFSAIRDGDYKKAKMEMLDSRWARQVKTRAIELAELMYAE